MQIQLIKGQFEAKEAAELLTQLIHVKIKYHEGKIRKDSAEEDIKMRETRIRELQKDLYEVLKYIQKQGESLNLHSEIQLTRKPDKRNWSTSRYTL